MPPETVEEVRPEAPSYINFREAIYSVITREESTGITGRSGIDWGPTGMTAGSVYPISLGVTEGGLEYIEFPYDFHIRVDPVLVPYRSPSLEADTWFYLWGSFHREMMEIYTIMLTEDISFKYKAKKINKIRKDAGITSRILIKFIARLMLCLREHEDLFERFRSGELPKELEHKKLSGLWGKLWRNYFSTMHNIFFIIKANGELEDVRSAINQSTLSGEEQTVIYNWVSCALKNKKPKIKNGRPIILIGDRNENLRSIVRQQSDKILPKRGICKSFL